VNSRSVLGIAIILFVAALFMAPQLNSTTVSPLVDYALDATPVAQRTGLNIAEGAGIELSAADEPTDNRVTYTLRTSARSGEATVSSGATPTIVSHGLAAGPARVLLSPTSNTAGVTWWASATTTSTFTITLDPATPLWATKTAPFGRVTQPFSFKTEG
jgi:hypothetical protein